jgi:hypothetical protein
VTLRRVPSVVFHVHVHGCAVTPDLGVAVVQVGQGAEDCHPLWCLHRVSSDEEEPQDLAAVDGVRLADAHRRVMAAVGDGTDWFQRPGRVNTPHQSRMSVTGPEDESSEMNSEWVPGVGVVLTGTHATQAESAAEVEKMFRGTKVYCVRGLERGCARAVKETKIEAAVEVASEE